MKPSKYSFGPFKVDEETNRVTMEPGVYTLHKPLTFALADETVVEDVEWKPLDRLAHEEWKRAKEAKECS